MYSGPNDFIGKNLIYKIDESFVAHVRGNPIPILPENEKSVKQKDIGVRYYYIEVHIK